MRRVHIEPRPNSSRLVQSQGLVFNQDPAPEHQHEVYWPDDRYYSFTTEEINLLERASRDVFEMLCEAADYLVQNPHIITGKMAIPAHCLRQIVESWDREPAFGSVYSRFDICFGGLDHPDLRLRVPKFYEFNADTPTSLLEGASIQWYWLEQTGHGPDQFNAIEESLVEAWRRNLAEAEKALGHRPKVVHFASMGDCSGEDEVNTEVLAATCAAAGYAVKKIWFDLIAMGSDGRFYDIDGEHIDVIFKLYPWEMMVTGKAGEACFADMENVGKRDEATGEYVGGTIWFEAPYKMLWSNKAVFAILWDLFKDDPRGQWLLPTYLEPEMPAGMTQFARKPIFAREGAGVTLRGGADGGVLSESDAGEYGKEGYVVQELALLPRFPDDRTGKAFFPVLGLWMVDGEPAGMGIREDVDLVTGNCSTFVPHVIEDAEEVNYERKPVPTLEEIEAALSIETYQNKALLGDDKAQGVLPYIDSVVASVA
ncbi:hypothetical protein RB598_009458 [Gaeumannomyces tritici]